MTSPSPLVITRWTTQAGRQRPAIAPGYVRLDERSFPDLLAEAARFAERVRYFDFDDTEQGNWSEFFRADIAMVLAAMMAFDATTRSTAFRRLRRQVRNERSDVQKLEGLEGLIGAILALAHEVDGWLATVEYLEPSPTTAAIRRLLASTIRHELAPLLERLRAYAAGAGHAGGLAHPVHLHCHHFQQVWRIGDICPDSSIYRGYSRRQKIDAALDPLDSLFETFVGVVSDLAGRAKGEFDACLHESHHKPHIALFMAFAKQFAAAQGRINDLPGRIVDFYYRKVLREPLRRPVPDRMFLCFTLAPRPGVNEAVVPRGTQFLAGADESGQPILFAADRTAVVTPATLIRVRALRAIRGAPYGGTCAPSGPGDRLQRIVSVEMAVGPDGRLVGAPAEGWPIFGGPAGGEDAKVAAAATLGFVVASRSLLLTGGDRSVTVTLRSSPGRGQFNLDPLLQQVAAATGLAAEAAMTRVLQEAFSLFVTTPQGWQAIPAFNVKVAPTTEGSDISFHLDLPPAFPPIVALDPLRARASSDPSPDPQYPALMAQLRQDPVVLSGDGGSVTIYPLSLLEALPVDGMRVEATVRDLPGVRVTTSAGLADAVGPFVPFGSPARVGAWFDIRHPELSTKALQRLIVTVQWLGLPSHPFGFAGHYEQYLIGTDREPLSHPIDNRSFRATLDLGAGGQWTLPHSCEDPPYLFRTSADVPVPSPSGRLLPSTRFMFENHPTSGADAAVRLLAPALRVTLSAPSFAFGDELYPPNVLLAVQPSPPPVAPPRKCWFCKLLGLIGLFPDPFEPPPPPDLAHAYPNQPWQPQIAGISVDYEATDRGGDGVGTDRLMHLLPSGALAAAMRGPDDRATLLPTSGQLTHLDLGFSALAPAQRLMLLFRMADEPAAASAANAAGRLTWRYRTVDQWIDLPQSALREDGTDGLTNSGIVSLDLPALAPDASVERLSWLRAVPRIDPDGFPAVVAITPHALSATRVIEGETPVLAPIPAKSVKAATPALRGIATIDQPIASFGGEVAESAALLPVRLGERLRHKERASLGWDYERLVLERFAEIAKVRVLPVQSANRTRRRGEVVIVVVPTAAGDPDKLMPRVGVDIRSRIQAGLQSATSAFARVRVVDPVYVRIAARVRVMFRHALDGNAPSRLNDDLCTFLAPCSEGMNLPDNAGHEEIRTAIGAFIESRPYVVSMLSLELSFAPDPESVDWCVPTSAEHHDISAVIETEGRSFCVPATIDESEYA